MAALKLIEEARSAGLRLRFEGDRLVIRGPKSAEPIAKALLDRKAEILPFLRERPTAWLCPHCGHPATIEDVFPSADGERTLTMWRCEPCQVVAVTPDAIRLPPTGWVKSIEQ